jgi:hypothetical protein
MASAYATEEAIINSMVAAEDMTGYRGVNVEALPHQELQGIMKQYNRTQETKDSADITKLPQPDNLSANLQIGDGSNQ